MNPLIERTTCYMYDLLIEAMEELKTKRKDIVENYEKFAKDYQKFCHELERSGLGYSPKDEDLFGIPYKESAKDDR